MESEFKEGKKNQNTSENVRRINRFEDIIAWKKARELNNKMYKITRNEKFDEDESLKDQIRRAVNSIMLNIAEGHASGSDKAFKNHLYIARGSTAEVKCALYISLDQQYITEKKFKELMGKSSEVSSIITGFIRYLRNNEKPRNNKKKDR